jgi:hypothetical protein
MFGSLLHNDPAWKLSIGKYELFSEDPRNGKKDRAITKIIGANETPTGFNK